MNPSSLTRPNIVFWEVTSQCNLNCIHCRRINKETPNISTSKAKIIIESVAKIDSNMLLFSGGEPLIRNDIFELISYAKSLNLSVSLASNGVLIDNSLASKLKELKIKRVSVSLDGASSQIHDQIRGEKGSFEAALSGISSLSKANIDFQINITITKKNLKELNSVYELALETQAKALHIFMLVPVGCGAEIPKQEMLSSQEYEEILKQILKLQLERKIEIRPTCAPHFQRIASRYTKSKIAGCLAAKRICFINYKGDVFPCGYLPISAGTIKDSSNLEGIWYNSSLFQDLRQLKLKGKCARCEFKKVCGGCRARAYSSFGDYLAQEPYCLYNPKINA